ncbi:MAG: acetate--CoA ligase family protein [SAR324 cluster bacterium]|nr:acetate--CoA ligase family protein [SAR324 cluster bacterium]
MNSKEIIQKVLSEGRSLLTEKESKDLIRNAGVNVIDTRLAASKEEAICIGEQLGYPVVAKISSKEVTHKSDAGGVKLGIQSSEELGNAYDEICASVAEKIPKASIEGVTVQQSARPGVEVIVGMFTDAQFGPVLMFGLGGIFVEVIKDVSFRIVPLAQKDSKRMIREIKGYPLLDGYRGQEKVDISILESIILKLSNFVGQYPEIKEFDLNPIFAYCDDAVVVDARVILNVEDIS